MINWLSARLQRPERGWDPVPDAYAREYAAGQWALDTTGILDAVERTTGSVRGRDVLDLGAGPGQYTLGFAERGARVTWYDVSKTYRDLAREQLTSRNAGSASNVDWQLGYLDEAGRLGRSFDLVFSRICWYYCMDDRRFARQVHALVRPGGWAYIVTPYLESSEQHVSSLHRLRGRLNDVLRLKIGHPFPTRRLFERVWRDLPTEWFDLEVSPRNLTVRFRRPDVPGRAA